MGPRQPVALSDGEQDLDHRRVVCDNTLWSGVEGYLFSVGVGNRYRERLDCWRRHGCCRFGGRFGVAAGPAASAMMRARSNAVETAFNRILPAPLRP